MNGGPLSQWRVGRVLGLQQITIGQKEFERWSGSLWKCGPGKEDLIQKKKEFDNWEGNCDSTPSNKSGNKRFSAYQLSRPSFSLEIQSQVQQKTQKIEKATQLI